MPAGVPAGNTLTEVSGKALTLAGTSTGGGIRGVYKTPPSAPYRIAILAQNMIIGDDSWPSFGWRDSANGHMHLLLPNGPAMDVQQYSNPTTFVGADKVTTMRSVDGSYLWVGLRDDGTNVYFELSQDGVNFVTYFTISKASGYLGSSGYNRVFFALRQNNSENSLLTIRVWDENGLSRSFP